ncbi:APC family permease [Treponema sp. Marseille-Q4130]|uniref:APC family permease n=1 Tax=Treponema sp. Marseille-Q4130 TaxID=2766702 RepID=UPI001651F163|nr:APC family permease [Treponema sp. Marseille-Q4130]MBC6719846.1 APC family permease [Treponema sp. Marseille-Q4130]
MNTVSAKKGLSKFDVLNLVIGSIIGWGSFILPGTFFLPKAGVVSTAIGLIIGGFFIAIIQKAYQVMLSCHVGEGGEFSYALSNLGKVHGFVVGWSLSLCYLSMIPLNATAYVLILRKIFGSAVLWGHLYTIGGTDVYASDIVIASIPIIVFTLVNLRGLSLSACIQNVMSTSLVVIVIALFFIILTKSDLENFSHNYFGASQISPAKIAPVVAIVPFLFVGFDVIPQVSNDLRFSPAKAHATAVVGIVFGVVIYALLNMIAGLSYDPEKASKLEWAVASSVTEKTGTVGFVFMLIALFSAVTGGINGFMIGSSKLLGAIANEKLSPAFLGEKNAKGLYPKAILFIAAVSLIGPWIGREVIILIVDMASVLAALSYGYVGFVGIKKSVSAFDKVSSALACGIGLLFIALLLWPTSPARLKNGSIVFLIAWTVLGILFYRFGASRRSKA